jgi:Protein of unknown function (DUF3108)
MKRRLITLCLLLPCLGAPAWPADQGAFPLDESLHYTVNWPSGLSLGEANLTAHSGAAGWDFELTLDAGIPGLRIADRFHSVARPDLCSIELDREVHQGARRTSEKTVFDYQKGIAHRTSLDGGGSSDDPISPRCAQDALAFLFEARRVLRQGGMAQGSKIFLGPAYSIHLENAGGQTVMVGGKPEMSDRIAVSVKGPASSSNFELFFARDAARTPLVARIPSSLGTISLELSR